MADDADLTRVVRAAIHPAIGFARVGNSPDEYFTAPETPDPRPAPPGSFKDASGAVKRQAARFRVYGYDATGAVVAELTAHNARVDWRAHLANAKSAWYQFHLALDIPDAAAARPAELRNRTISGADRAKLVIDPGPREVTGRNARPARFDTGTCMGRPVHLGELRTDADGRLLVLGGRGASGTFDGSPITGYGNNDGWYDDIADGPVRARVAIGGRTIPVTPAWVVVAPPNYAPALKTVRTLYDLLLDVFIHTGALAFPTRVSFTRHILPILRRFCDLQWVNQGFATFFGWSGRGDFLDEPYLRRLASADAADQELRRQVFAMLRDHERDGRSPVPWPWIYGDAMASRPVSVLQHLALSPTQYRLMEQWALGAFDADHDPHAPEPPGELSAVPLAEQPATLDRAALDFCLADAFHPGCEVTWPIRHATMFSEPFRIRHRPDGQQEPSYGTRLTPQAALAVGGPLYAQGPGGLTRWMAVPWQTDTASCRSGYEHVLNPRYDPYLPTFWPARVPNHVLTREDYDTVMDTTRPLAERRAAFERRAVWLRGLTGQINEQRRQMVDDWVRLGIVETRPGPADGAFPATLQVESPPAFDLRDVAGTHNLITLHVPEAADPEAAEAAIGQAVAQAAAVSGFREDEITAGYVDKVAPFGDDA